jgi:hypothetical protein
MPTLPNAKNSSPMAFHDLPVPFGSMVAFPALPGNQTAICHLFLAF